MHNLYERMLFKQEISRLKYVGAFALLALWCFFSGERGFSSDALFAIGTVGIALLVILTLDEIFFVADFIRKRGLYEAEGIANRGKLSLNSSPYLFSGCYIKKTS